MIKIALAGNPNSGKTTFFNMLSGKRERIGNWAGVTISKKESRLRRKYRFFDEEVIIVDLPGAYSLSAYTSDEYQATEVLKNEKIDTIINIVDSSNLERSLRFTLELINTNIPVVLALNKVDIIKQIKTTIDTASLSKLLGVPVHFTRATVGEGLYEILRSTKELVTQERKNDGK